MPGKKRKLADEEIPEPKNLTICQMLKIAREDLKLSLEEIAEELRIGPHFLEALEGDDLDVFSAPVFAKGYLRQYGNRLGLRVADLLAQYYRQAEDHEVMPASRISIRVGGARSIARWKFIFWVLFLLAVVGFTIWFFYVPEKIDPEVNAPVAGELGVDSLNSGRFESPSVHESLPFDRPSVVSGPVVTEAVVPHHVGFVAEPSNVVFAETSLQVEIRFVEDCWTEINDGSSQRLFYGLAASGSVSQFSGTPPISFFLGNAEGVKIFVNGVPFPVPSENRRGNLARFDLQDSNS